MKKYDAIRVKCRLDTNTDCEVGDDILIDDPNPDDGAKIISEVLDESVGTITKPSDSNNKQDSFAKKT